MKIGKLRDYSFPVLLAFWLFCLFPTQSTAATISCASDSDSCQGDNSSLFAIAHSWTDPETDVLYRVAIPAWSVGADWTGEHNGFFYQAVVHQSDGSGESSYYVPFNGIRIGAEGRPEIPAFHFIVSADVAAAGASLDIKACSSDYAYTGSVKTPTCTTQF